MTKQPDQDRLDFVRALPYAEYLLTPEWAETRHQTLERAHHRCQICLNDDASVEVYHTTAERLGAEREHDLVALCRTCHGALTRAGKLIEREPPLPHFSLTERLRIAGPTALVGMGLPALLHAPLPAELAGLGVAVYLAIKFPSVYTDLKSMLPEPVMGMMDKMIRQKQERRAAGEWSVGDKLMGRHLRDTQSVPHDEAQEGEMREDEDEEDPDEEPLPSLEPVFPHYTDRVTLHLGKAIDRAALATLTSAYQQGKEHYTHTVVPGRRFDPHFNQVLGKGWVIAAVQGSGKSVLNGLMIEQAGHAGLPVIVFDHKGEYDTVKALPFMHTLLVGGRGEVDFVLSPELVDEFVSLVFKQRYQAIINLPSYGTGWLAKATIVAAVGEALMRYAEAQLRMGKKVLPCFVILDEAHLYLPEDTSLLPPEAQAHKTTTLAALKNAYFALATVGRSAGYTVGFATQSLTYLAKWAIKSVQVKIYGRHVEKNDLDECVRTIDKEVATRAEIESFPPGVAVVSNLTSPAMIVQFDQKEAEDKSETPGIERLHEEERTPGRRYEDTEVITTEMLLKVLRQAGVDVNGLQRQHSSHNQKEQIPTVRMQPRAIPPLGMHEQHAHFPWSQPMPQLQQTDMEDLPLKAGQMQAGTPPYPHPVESQEQAREVQPSQPQPTRHFTAALSPELQRAYDAYQPGMTHRDLGRVLNMSHPTAGKLLQRLKDKGAIDNAGRKMLTN